MLRANLRVFDRLGEDLAVIERDLARSALADENVARLIAIPGIDMVVALAVIAAIGDINRFGEPQKLVSYLGLNPSVRQSGPGPAHHGRITKQGRGHARGMLVEAAWAAARAPGPLRAFFLRVRAKRGQHVAAVATARKLSVPMLHRRTMKSTPWRANRRCKPKFVGRTQVLSPAKRGRKAAPTPITSRAIGSRSGASSNRPRSLWPFIALSPWLPALRQGVTDARLPGTPQKWHGWQRHTAH